MGMVKDFSDLDPWEIVKPCLGEAQGNDKPSLMVLVKMLIVYTEHVHCGFLPQIFTSLLRMFLPRLTKPVFLFTCK